MQEFTYSLLTGANGFLGKYIYHELLKFSSVDTLARSGSSLNVDLSTKQPVFDKVYDLVVHSAGKAHSVPVTPTEKQSFYNVNLKGTENLLNALEASSRVPRAFVFISSVAVYGLDYGVNIKEDHELNATEPYGHSKILAERLVSEWCLRNKVICTILRLPLIAGENAPGNLGTMIKGIQNGYYFNIDGGRARKSVVLAQDVANIIWQAAKVGGVFNLTDGQHPSFTELSSRIANQVNRSTPVLNIPVWLAKVLGKLGDLLGDRAPVNSAKIKKINSDLTFNDEKARTLLNWTPMSVKDGLEL